jgi:hypothetical protein
MRRQWLLAALVAVPRLFVFPLNENLHGDAIARTWLAHLWLQHPHVIGGFDQGARQFGPLHIYLLALAEWLWPSLLDAGRVVSVVAGVATTFPLYSLTRRLFGVDAAVAAVVGLACWGLHVQGSTTSASEALNLLLVVAALERFAAWLSTPAAAPRDALLAALALNLACATRYDSWLLVPLLGLVVAWHRRSVLTAGWFVAASSAFATAWLFGNAVDRGSPMFVFHYIDDFHRAWFPSEQAIWGPLRYRLLCLFFWPGAAVLSLSPLVGVASFVGLVRAWRQRRGRWLVGVILVPVVLYTFRSVALSSFAPLLRFTMKELMLLLPFAWFGLSPLLDLLGAWRVRVVALVAVSCVAWTTGLGLFCFRGEGQWQVTLSPLSPTSSIDASSRAVTDWLRARSSGTDLVLIDADPAGYADMVIGYFSGFSYERQARQRSPHFELRLRGGRVGYVVRFDGGPLSADPRVSIGASHVVWQGETFEEVAGFQAPLHLYQRRSASP